MATSWKAGEPTGMELGEMLVRPGADTLKSTILESVPPGLITRTMIWAGAVIRLAGTVAVSVPLTSVADNAAPKKEICEPGRNEEPVAVNWKAGDPAGIFTWERDVITGASTENVIWLEIAPPGLVTRTLN